MQELEGKVAVITGGASGIGLAMAQRLAGAGMKLVVADIEEQALDAAASLLREDGADVTLAVCDVSDRDQLDVLADLTYTAHGAAHVLCNNAGVVGRHMSWDDRDTWDWVLGVDLMGVVYGVTAFVPRMLDAGEPGHVVNTASTAGLLSFPGIASYNVAKHGVVALSQTMYHEFHDTSLGVSVLCPGLVATRINTSDRNRPGAEIASGDEPEVDIHAGETLTAEIVADQVHDAIVDGSFWVLPHPHYADQAIDQAERRKRGEGPVMPRINR